MKKFLFIVLLLSFGIGKVWASDIYYSSYTSFSDWKEQQINPSDTTYVEEETRYLWYQIYQVPGDYALFQSGGQFLNDCYDTTLSAWSTMLPTSYESRTIQERTKYTYKLDTEIRYIHLTNVSGSYYSFRIPELRTIVNGQDIPYTYTCNGCNDTFDSHIHNGNRYENWSSLTNGGNLTIDLGAVYPAHKVELQFYIYDVGTDPKQYTVSFSKDGFNMFASQSYTLYFSGMEYEQSEYRIHNIYNMGVEEKAWTTIDTTYTPYTNDFQLSTTTEKEYAYTDKMCRTYTESREYSKDYWKNGNDVFPYQDISQSKTYYRYQEREKLELSDIDIIEEKRTNWNDLVLYSSQPYEVIEAIDWSKNGMYPITFQVGDWKVTKEFEIRLVENQLVEYERQITELQNQIQQSKINLEEQKSRYEQQIEGLEQEVSSLRQQLQNCEENCKSDKECLQDIIDKKNQLLEQYEQKIEELSNTLNEYQVKLVEQEERFSILQGEMQTLQERFNQLKKNNQELSIVIQGYESKLEKYQQDISKLTTDNDFYRQLLKDKQVELIQVEKSNLEYLEDIEKLKETLEMTIQDKNNEISIMEIESQRQLNNKDKLIEAYKNKIEQLSEQLTNIRKQIGQVMDNHNQTNIENTQLKSLLQELEQQNRELQEEKIKEEQRQTEDAMVIQQKETLNQKLNNYILKIRGEKTINLLWFYVICLVIFIGILIYKWRKKSNVK